jgi:hypothetical protein
MEYCTIHPTTQLTLDWASRAAGEREPSYCLDCARDLRKQMQRSTAIDGMERKQVQRSTTSEGTEIPAVKPKQEFARTPFSLSRRT